MILYILNVIGFLLAIAGLYWLSKKVVEKSKVLAATESTLDMVRAHTERQAAEIRGWRTMFGPFYSLYENSPESASCCADDKTIAIDLDGVILEYVEPWTGITHFGDPTPGAAEAIQKLKDLGYTIVVYTTRNNAMAKHNQGQNALALTALVQNKLEEHGIPYDYISLFKPLARYYIDDRAVRFSSWPLTMRIIRNLEVARLVDKAKVLDVALADKGTAQAETEKADSK